MKHRLTYSIFTFLLIALALANSINATAAANKAIPLITDYNRIRVNNLEQNQGVNGLFGGRLIDGDPYTVFHSNYTYGVQSEALSKDVETMKAPTFIEIHLNEPTKSDDNLYIYTQARSGSNNGHPKQFMVSGSFNGVDWVDISTVNVPFSGTAMSPGEENYSGKFNVPSGYTWLKFTCTENSDGHNPGGYPLLILAEFQVYKSDVDLSRIKAEPALMMADDHHTIFDYNDNYADYEFKHTHGILDNINHENKNLRNWCDWSKWIDGKWADADELSEQGIEMPDFTYINKETAPWGRVKLGDRQRTHVTEHTVYAIPGQVTTLYPYSDINTATQYEENFIRWYDYVTDGNNRFLDFLHDPSRVARSNKYGFYGSYVLTNASTEKYDVYIYTVDDYRRLIERVQNGESRLTVRQCADLDFNGCNDILPIGWSSDKPFRGVYDGGSYAISNLVIDKPDWGEVGMFGHVGSATIRNLNVHSSCKFIGKRYVGLVGAIDAPEYMASNTTGTLLIHNVSTHATIKAEEANAGGLLGCNVRWTSQFQVMIYNCAVLGSVSGGWESAAICGWSGNHTTLYNVYNVASVSGIESQAKAFNRGATCFFGSCYDNNEGNGRAKLPYDITDSRLIDALGGSSNWITGGWGYVLPSLSSPSNVSSRNRGTFATFYCPADDTFDTEYIAADFSQKCDLYRNIDHKTKTINEPVLVYRHIFTVINAEKLAETISGSVENNSKYISENRRTIRARAGVDFQVRFEHPQPVDQTTRTTMFYKDPQGVIRRVRKSKIKVTDRTGADRSGIFYQIANYKRPGARKLPYGDLPDMYDLEKEYARMMKCDAKDANGRFTVHLVGCDEGGKELKIYGSDKELILAEYIVNFVDENGAVMTSEAEMHTDKYAHTRPAKLNELYGNPIAVVNFDEFRMLDNRQDRSNYIFDGPNIPNGTGMSRKYKWPVTWENSQYGYGYDTPHDFSMYMIADHSVVTPYKSSAETAPASENFGKGTGRFDRLFYDTEGAERGFFYYANAASDPGVTAKIDIKDLCPGSTLFVSAWLCEFSSNVEVQNIIFNFNVVKNDGSEVTLHSFVTGYVPTVGNWHHVFYQFTPNLSQLGLTNEEIHSYKIVLENNCLSSAGADYAIDDIRVYAAKPRVYAQQTTPLCRGEHGTDVQIQTPFDVMLATLGANEASTESTGAVVDCYYTFVDKDKYDKSIASGMTGTEAYNAAVVKYEYMAGGGNDQTFGHLTFNTHYQSNTLFTEGNSEVSDEAFRAIIEGDRYLVINTNPRDKDLVTGKEYIVALYVNERVDGEEIKPDAAMFDISSKCAKSSTFRIHASGVIKIDGIIVPNLDNITVCQNQTPVVQIDIQSKDNNTGSFSEATPNAITDWWDGSMESFLAQYEPKSNMPLNTVLSIFRMEYPEAETWDMPAKGDYTELLRTYLKTLTEPDTNTGTPARLLLYRSSYVFRPVTIPPGEESTHIYAVAIPIDIYSDDVTVCTTPSEIRLTVRNNSPELNHGLPIDYPSWIEDVPLRIGLRQLDRVSVPEGNADNAQKLLSIPVRMVSVVTEGVDALERIPDDHSLYLVQTDDPEYLDLNVETENGITTGLYAIGAINEIVARPSNDNANVLRMAFDKDFTFKEGHYYRMRFSFRENGVPSLPTGGDGEGEPRHCHGQHVFSIKVVPEYQAWVGAADSTNWNNDNNWRRVSTADLLHTVSENDSEINRFVTDRTELTATSKSFVPMDFTKVIIPAGASVPHLYQGVTSPVTVDGKNYLWLKDLSAPIGVSSPTTDIAYDMAAHNTTEGIGCRPWYTNTCDEIHFHSNSSILGQTLLNHNRAWVDFEIEPHMWYTLSSPLTGVVAGDMYLPTAGARQLTELFKPITFSTNINNRFAPAVYQRSWNKAKAMVYELGGNATGTNVAVRTTWSHVYNDVAEPYGTPATGFSIKADISKLEESEKVQHVMFRLPKDDDSYLYYDNNGEAPGHNTSIDRSVGNKLHSGSNGIVTTTVSSAAPGRYFLVGNPFMAHLDMAYFLSDNSNVINPKYWVMNSEGQACAIYNPGTGSFESTLSEPSLLAPMQGFFVEAKNDVSSLTLSFNAEATEIVSYDPAKGNFLRTPELNKGESTMSRSSSQTMRITAMRDDKPLSQAILVLDPSASDSYNETEDVALILDSHCTENTSVYTIAGNMAASVNSIPEVTTTELCVAAKPEELTVLHFENTQAYNNAMLADVLTGETMPLYDGMEYEITGAATSRLYIVAAADDVLASNAITVTIEDNNITVCAPDNGLGLDIAVYDMTGRVIANHSTANNSAKLTLEQGIYILEARNAGVEPLRTKILVKR